MKTVRLPILVWFIACLLAGFGIGEFLELHAQVPHGTASEEVPRGVIDGTNTLFTLNFQPAPWGSIHVYRNGLRQQRNNDFTLGGLNHTQVIFNTIATPQPGDILLADYTY